MRQISKNKTLLIFIAFGFFLVVSAAMFNLRNSTEISVNNSEESVLTDIPGNPKGSGFWTESPITINDTAAGVGAHNWTWAVAQAWCSGAGTVGDPYVIENVTIDGGDASSCLKITDSSVYVTVNNCTFYNASDAEAGLYLLDANNITVTDCTIYNNTGYGIYVNGSDNTFYGNTLANNTDYNAQDDDLLSGNVWDNGVDSGNTWDDYSGVDENDNGIGDTPYNITGDAESQDRYPVYSDGTDVVVTPSVSTSTSSDDDDKDEVIYKLNVNPTVMIVTAVVIFGLFKLVHFYRRS